MFMTGKAIQAPGQDYGVIATALRSATETKDGQ